MQAKIIPQLLCLIKYGISYDRRSLGMQADMFVICALTLNFSTQVHWSPIIINILCGTIQKGMNI